MSVYYILKVYLDGILYANEHHIIGVNDTYTLELNEQNIIEVNENIEKKNFTIIDARSKERFNGSVPDPRKNVRSGSIPNSVCLPFKEIINTSNNTFKNVNEISEKFREIIDLNDDKRVFSCGSGITACVLGLAYSLVNNKYSPTVYDGSWAEYGKL